MENSDSSSSSDGISSVNEGIVVSSRVYITLVKLYTYFCTFFLYMEQNYSHRKFLLLYVLKCFIFFFTFFNVGNNKTGVGNDKDVVIKVNSERKNSESMYNDSTSSTSGDSCSSSSEKTPPNEGMFFALCHYMTFIN